MKTPPEPSAQPVKLSEFQETVLRHASNIKGGAGYAAKSCNRHIDRALRLQEEMPEVALFLAITAEEEAASSIFHVLEKRRYDRWKEIRRRDHKYKSAVYPIIRLVGGALVPEDSNIKVNIYFGSTEGPDINGPLRVAIPIILSNGEKKNLLPHPPLDLTAKEEDGTPRNYLEEIKRIASEQGVKSVFEYVKSISNKRNTLLYSSSTSIPQCKDIRNDLTRHVNAALLLLIICLLIEPYGIQDIVQQSLYGYLDILQRIDN